MKLVFRQSVGFWALTFVLFTSWLAHAETPAKPQILQIWDARPKAQFDSEILPVAQAEWSHCSSCSVHNLTAYDDKGQAVVSAAGPAWSNWGTPEAFAAQTPILLLNANYRMTADLKPWVDFLNQVAEQGTLIVLAAGQPAKGENSAPLSVTLAGKIKRGLIIGELGEKDRLWGASFFGPEMFTALRPTKERIGQGGAPAQFAARLLSVYPKQSDWFSVLQQKKANNRKIWLELSNCFGH
jgi:hypothetical protein